MTICKYLIALLALNVSLCHAQDEYAFFIASAPENFNGEAVIKTENTYYVGQLKGGKPHEKGTMVDYSGHIISGEWVNGTFSGQGATIDLVPVRSLKASKHSASAASSKGILIMDEKVYQGPFNQYQLPHGKGICYEGSEQTSCEYKNGVKQ
ncbi:MAG: hypothetical protein R3208_01775 [Ketobacteraceae bacterium]|nr:hypothetical protein [Ketobacteraceae bacterium]